jgi:hypothetical protein
MSGFDKQQTAERDAAAFTARELLNAAIVRRAAQRVHRHVDLAVDVPRVGLRRSALAASSSPP